MSVKGFHLTWGFQITIKLSAAGFLIENISYDFEKKSSTFWYC